MIKYKIGLILLVLLAFAACKEEQKILTSTTSVFYFESSHVGCEEGFGKIVEGLGHGTVVFSSFNDTILVVHHNARYNCCAEIEAEVKKTKHGFDIFEKDAGDPCRCMCYHLEIATLIYNVSAGTYFINVFDTDGNMVDQRYVIVRPNDDSGPQG